MESKDVFCPLLRQPCMGDECAWWTTRSWYNDMLEKWVYEQEGCAITFLADDINR